jgi:hypothetical protein
MRYRLVVIGIISPIGSSLKAISRQVVSFFEVKSVIWQL